MRFTGLLTVAAIALSTGSVLSAQSTDASLRPAISCTQLKDVREDGLRIDSTELIKAGPQLRPDGSHAGESLPEHCRVQGVLNARRGAEGQQLGIGFELRLPSLWNGRFLFQGGGGLDGVLNPALGSVANGSFPSALARGFAVVSNDGGHRGASPLDSQFGLDQQARLDYAFNALDKTTLISKSLTRRYYDHAPDRSYFMGCSNGGRQGLMAAQRFPLHFDGIVAGAPTFNFSRIVMNQVWNVQVASRIAPKDASGSPINSRAFSDSDLQLVTRSVVNACDASDGLADGIINNVMSCPFDPAALTCKGGKNDECLTSQQVTGLKDIMGGARNSRGEPQYGRFPFDTGIGNPAWRRMHIGTSQTARTDAADANLGFDTLRMVMMTPPAPNFDPMKFDFDRDVSRVQQMGAATDADATYLRTFAERGKLIVYHGTSDQGMAAGALTDWYDRVKADTPGATEDFARLFLVPGMTHCGGGQSTDRFDMLTAIQSWVEEGRAPNRVVATGPALPGISRPLCPYPQIARYRGGDTNSEASFTCAP
jgi:hypothetical protein